MLVETPNGPDQAQVPVKTAQIADKLEIDLVKQLAREPRVLCSQHFEIPTLHLSNQAIFARCDLIVRRFFVDER